MPVTGTRTRMQIDLSVAYKTIEKMGLTFVAALPRLVVAVLVLAVFYVAGRGLSWAVIRGTGRFRGRRNLELAVARLIHATIVAFSILVAATIVFPSFTAGTLISLLGVSGIAVGFAFKDIFQNFLAGLLLLITDPFDIGDQIVVDAYEGTVEDIQTRATLITTYDHRRVVVPNADLFTKSVTVNTAFLTRRSEFDVAVPATLDIGRLKERLVQRIEQVDGVTHAPAPEVLLVKFDMANVTLRLRWWTYPQHGSAIAVQDRVLTVAREEIGAAQAEQQKRAAEEAGRGARDAGRG
ncbi:MAG TPA: mechanosensitive ion channel domain-containing protein [Gemmatimonadaceae bacterium]|nr:mechanosensitive ion channel domain-containing protein [Gemmatimonadaceae bacterium]